MGFKQSLKIGKIGEQLVFDVLQKLNLSPKLLNHKNHYDIIFIWNNQEIGVEVKYDIMAQKTNNIAIEFFNSKSNKPTGIYATTAKLWSVVISETEMYISSVGKVKQYIEKNKPYKIFYNAGDGNADILLYKCDSILPDIFFPINIENIRLLLS